MVEFNLKTKMASIELNVPTGAFFIAISVLISVISGLKNKNISYFRSLILIGHVTSYGRMMKLHRCMLTHTDMHLTKIKNHSNGIQFQRDRE